MERSTILYSKNIKPSNTLIVRAALRLLPRDHTFIEAVEQLIQEGKRRAND
ncbi:hypothetical protein OPIT5_00400 (plasmid) [Opitutaceae bacterium TAV5]|nr:hypothetical protein OPIT5_00400 [Opitutaceae bacterium TAV5]